MKKLSKQEALLQAVVICFITYNFFKEMEENNGYIVSYNIQSTDKNIEFGTESKDRFGLCVYRAAGQGAGGRPGLFRRSGFACQRESEGFCPEF